MGWEYFDVLNFKFGSLPEGQMKIAKFGYCVSLSIGTEGLGREPNMLETTSPSFYLLPSNIY